MKIRHIYTVVREHEIHQRELDREIDFFKDMKDEIGEYLYGGLRPNCYDKEQLSLKMMVSKDDKTWKTIG